MPILAVFDRISRKVGRLLETDLHIYTNVTQVQALMHLSNVPSTGGSQLAPVTPPAPPPAPPR
jgi:hypothetical protein